MDNDAQIERTESMIAVWRVELEDWIPAKCLIEDRINVLKINIEVFEENLRLLQEEAGK